MASVAKRTWTHKGEEKTAWVVRYADQGGKRRLKSFDKKKEADIFRAKTEVEIKEGVHLSDSEAITFGEALDLFLDEADRRSRENHGIRVNTAYHWRLMAEKHVRPFLAATKVNRISIPQVQSWLNDLAYNMPERRGRCAIEKALQIVRLTLAEAQARGLVPRNVVKGAQLRIPGAVSEPVAIPTKEEVRRLLAGAEGFLRPFLYVAVLAGLRKGEIGALTWENVDLNDGVIHVRKSLSRGVIGPPKTAKGRRTVPLSPDLLKALREWKVACPPSEAAYVFPSPLTGGARDAEPIHQQWCALQVKVGLVEANLEKPRWKQDRAKYRFHTLRHVAASLLIETGLPPKRIQDIMGHASIQMTFDRYGHLFDNAEQTKNAMAKMSLALSA